MDRSSSLGKERSRDISSDERFEKANRPRQSPASSEVPSDTEDLDAARVPSFNAKQRPSSTAALPAFGDDEAMQLDSASWMPVHDFSEIPAKFIAAFEALQETERNASSKHKKAKHPETNETGLKAARKLIKSQVKHGKSLEDTEPYQLLRGSRSGKSGMEAKLPAESAFRALLYPPTGGVRDTRTGLYAELRMIKSDGEATCLLCFPGTGVADNEGKQWAANLQQALGAGRVPRLYKQALALANELKMALANEGLELRVAGHSLGGGVANFVGLALNMESYCFNAAALGKKSREFLKIQGCLTAERIRSQNHVTLKGDFASSPQLSRVIKVVSRTTQGPTPIGKVYLGTDDHDDFPESRNPLARHPLSAMENMIDTQKFQLWQKARKEKASAAPSSSTPVAPRPTDKPDETSSASMSGARSSVQDEGDSPETS